MNRRYPRYPDDADYQTNAPSYYEDLARKQKLIQLLAEKIWEYDERLDDSLENIENILDHYIDIVDGKLSLIDHKINEGFNDEINDLLVQWVNDGTLEHIINVEIFNTKADKTDLDEVKTYLEKSKDNIVNLDHFTVGDGVTVDDANIKEAIDYLDSLGGGKLTGSKTYFIENSIVIPYDNILLENLTFNLASNGKIRFQKTDTAIPTNVYSRDYNNLPPYKNLNYFDPVEYGGISDRSKNIGCRNVTFNKVNGSSGSQHGLHFFKVDGIVLDNVTFTFENEQSSIGSTQDNALTFYYCSDVEMKNITIHDNYRVGFGIFVYWSYGFKMFNIKTGNVGVRGLEIKHLVNAEINRITCHVKDANTSVRGMSVHYGSRDIRLKNIHTINCDLGLLSAVEFQYNQDIHLDGLVSVGGSLILSNLKNFTINNVEIRSINNRSEAQAIQILMQPYYNKEVNSLEGYTKNSDYFTFDGDYDTYNELVHAGISHYRLNTYQQSPTLLNGKITNIKVTLEKVSNGVSRQDFYSFYFYGEGNIPQTSLVENGRYKIRNGHYPISIKNVVINDYEISFIGNNNSNQTVVHHFFTAPKVTFDDVTIKNVKENVNGVVGTGNIPEISNMPLLQLGKLDKVHLYNFDLMPYATYGRFLIAIKGYNDVMLEKIKVKISNLTGSYNPTDLKIIEIRTGESLEDKDMINEDYNRISFIDVDVKGFKNFIYFERDSSEFNTDQYNRTRVINSDVENSDFTPENYEFVRDQLNRVIPSQEMLNTVNNEPKI